MNGLRKVGGKKTNEMCGLTLTFSNYLASFTADSRDWGRIKQGQGVGREGCPSTDVSLEEGRGGGRGGEN